MFHIKFCVKCDWNFRGFLKIRITFYKHILNISNGNNMQKKLSIKLAIAELSSCIFRRENKIFVDFFLNLKIGMRVYKGQIEARSESISFEHILEDISTRNQYFEKN